MKKTFALGILALMMLLALPVQAQRKYSFRGKLGEKILFRLDLEQNKEGVIAGETTYYRKNGQVAKLRVVGWYDSPEEQANPTLNLTEYDGTKQCGYFSIELKGGKVSGGNWFLSGKEYKELEINDLEMTQFPAGVRYLQPAVASPKITGEYSYTFDRAGIDECGGTCELKFVGGNKVKYSISSVTPNIAESEGTGSLQNGYFNSKHGNYHFRAYVDKNFVYIWPTNDGYVEVDDWGAHATIAGTYIRK